MREKFKTKQVFLQVAAKLGYSTGIIEAKSKGHDCYIFLDESRGKMNIAKACMTDRTISHVYDHPMLNTRLAPVEMYHYLVGILAGMRIAERLPEKE